MWGRQRGRCPGKPQCQLGVAHSWGKKQLQLPPPATHDIPDPKVDLFMDFCRLPLQNQPTYHITYRSIYLGQLGENNVSAICCLAITNTSTNPSNGEMKTNLPEIPLTGVLIMVLMSIVEHICPKSLIVVQLVVIW